MTDKINQVKFFKKTLLLPNVNPKVVHGMFYLTLSNADIDFFRFETLVEDLYHQKGFFNY